MTFGGSLFWGSGGFEVVGWVILYSEKINSLEMDYYVLSLWQRLRAVW